MYVNKANGKGTDTALEIEEENDPTFSEIKDSVIEDVEFITGRNYLKSEVCWICKDMYSNKAIIQPCHCPTKTGAVHPACLISWMNTYCKGRCPTCACMFLVKTEQRPKSQWQPDPMLRDNKTKYIVMVALNLVVTVVSFVSIAHLVHNDSERSKARVAVAAVIGVVFLFYLFYQSRLYVRIYERLKIYNNKVTEVYESEEQGDKWGAEGRHNLSSFIDQSEL